MAISLGLLANKKTEHTLAKKAGKRSRGAFAEGLRAESKTQIVPLDVQYSAYCDVQCLLMSKERKKDLRLPFGTDVKCQA
eukprot:1160211-Pelagomonas_calceolata.AAC.3